jgi:hypothetical protein
MFMMLYRMILVALFWFIIPPNFSIAAENDNCSPNLTAAAAALTEAQSALNRNDLTAALKTISEARAALQLIEASCTTQADGDAGNSRTDPVPFGQRQDLTIGDTFDGSVEITGYTDNADKLVQQTNDRNDPPETGNRYIVINFDIFCEGDPAKNCHFNPFQFKVVGSKGIAYKTEITNARGFSTDIVDFFGGAQISVTLVYTVDAEETDFVLYSDVRRNPVFFATQ